MAALLADHIAGARRSLQIAIYDLKLDGDSAHLLQEAIRAAQSRGVGIRLVYNDQHPHERPLPPPGFVDPEFLRLAGVESRAISGIPDLMHHKYVVRDAGSPDALVWTGSTNWTTDSWTREENVIVRIASQDVADTYLANFEELWDKRVVRQSGHQAADWSRLDEQLRVRPYFTPARAPGLVHELALQIARAQRRLRICSPVLTSGPILASLAERLAAPRGLDIQGCYDRTQMVEVSHQWAEQPQSAWKQRLWDTVREGIAWGAKESTPYNPGSIHDFMHAKCMVADDRVFVGSYNLSHSGEENAENVLEIENPATADMFAGFIERVAERYRS